MVIALLTQQVLDLFAHNLPQDNSREWGDAQLH